MSIARKVPAAFIQTVRKWIIFLAGIAVIASFVTEYGFYLSSAQEQ